MLGGHGYSAYSGLSRLYHGQDINQTWEGDNNMLLQQSTKYILKVYEKMMKGKNMDLNKLHFLMDDLEVPDELTKEQLLSWEMMERIVKNRVQKSVQECMGEMMAMN
jgi:hypothetical protein